MWFVLLFVLVGWLLVRLARPANPRMAGPSTFPTMVRGLIRAGCWVALLVLTFYSAMLITHPETAGDVPHQIGITAIMLVILAPWPIWMLRALPVAPRMCRSCGRTSTTKRCAHCRAGAQEPRTGPPDQSRTDVEAGGYLGRAPVALPASLERARQAWVRVSTQPKRR